MKKRKKKDLHLPVDLASSVQLVSIKKKKKSPPKKEELETVSSLMDFLNVCMCVDGGGRGVRNKEASKHCESVSSKAHKYSSLVLISPTHTHTRTHALTLTHTRTHTHTHTSTNRNVNSSSPQHTHKKTQPNKLQNYFGEVLAIAAGGRGGPRGAPAAVPASPAAPAAAPAPLPPSSPDR